MKEVNNKIGTKDDSLLSSGLLAQIITALFALVFMIASIFENSFLSIGQLFIAFLLFIMAYNNYKLYHRKYVTPIYTIGGLVFILYLGYVMFYGK